MAVKVDYYTSLSRAVAALDRDSYAARGAVYDREHKALMRRLFSADPPLPDEEIESEQQAFRAAVRRIEFGDEDDHVPLVPQRDTNNEEPASEPAVSLPTPAAVTPEAMPRARRNERDLTPEPPPLPPRTAAREPQWQPRKAAIEPVAPPLPAWAQRKSSADKSSAEKLVADKPVADKLVAEKLAPESPAPAATHWSQRKPTQQLPWQELEATLQTALDDQAAGAATPADAAHEAAVVAAEPRKRRPIAGRIIGRTLLAALVLGIGIVSYGLASGDITLPSLVTRLASKAAATAENAAAPQPQAVIFDSNPPNPEGSKGIGTTVWRARAEPATAQRPATTVLQFDVKIPDRRLNLSMTMRPEVAGSAMSHLIELRFLREDGQPDPDIDNIASIVMTTVEQQRPRVLVGRVVRVAPGVFLFGLSGEEKDVAQNLRYLKEETWFDIPLSYRNGASGVLAVEKGGSGVDAIDEALSQWARLAAAPADR